MLKLKTYKYRIYIGFDSMLGVESNKNSMLIFGSNAVLIAGYPAYVIRKDISWEK